jgi:hypothetical protein
MRIKKNVLRKSSVGNSVIAVNQAFTEYLQDGVRHTAYNISEEGESP